MGKNYLSWYEVLEIETSATNAEIERAYKKKWLKYHPDKNDGSDLAHKLFQQVTDAKEVLLDPIKRLEHDYMIGVKVRPVPAPTFNYPPPPPQTNSFGKVVVTTAALYGGYKFIEWLFGKSK